MPEEDTTQQTQDDTGTQDTQQSNITIPDGYELVPKGTMEGVTKRLDFLEKSFTQPPTQPAAPAGPTIEEQVANIDAEIAKIDTAIDDMNALIAEGKPTNVKMSDLLKQREAYTTHKVSIQTDAKINAATAQSTTVVNQLTDEVVSKSMPHIDLVKGDYDEILTAMPENVRSSPAARREAYNLACGRNVDKIVEAETERVNRQQTNTDTQDTGDAGTGRDAQSTRSSGKPTFEETFGEDAMRSLRRAGRTPEQQARSLGYKDVDEMIADKLAYDEQVFGVEEGEA